MRKDEIENGSPARSRIWQLALVTIFSGFCLWLGLVIFKAVFTQIVAQQMVMLVFSASLIVLLGLVGLTAVFSRLIPPPQQPPDPPSDSDEG